MSTYDEFINETVQLMIEKSGYSTLMGKSGYSAERVSPIDYRSVASDPERTAYFYQIYFCYSIDYDRLFFMRHARWLYELEDVYDESKDTHLPYYNGFMSLWQRTKDGENKGLTVDDIYTLHTNHTISDKVKYHFIFTQSSVHDQLCQKLLQLNILDLSTGIYGLVGHNDEKVKTAFTRMRTKNDAKDYDNV